MAKLTADIVPGKSSSNASPVISFNGLLFFIARDADHGIEWWTTNGTTAGAHLFMDINPGPNSAQPFGRGECR